MDNESLGNKLKHFREMRGLTRGEFALKTGIGEENVASLEKRASTRLSAENVLKLSRAFDMTTDQVYEELGLKPPRKSKDTYIDLWERAKAAAPVPIPVYSDFKVHMGGVREMPVDYVYQSREKIGNHHKEGLRCIGDCMEPLIHDGETVIVDLDASPLPGNLILCLTDEGLIVGRYVIENGTPKVKNGHGTHPITECMRSAVVEGFYRDAPGF
jgi:transcriptional regulator with XRE-family HTH domain